MKALTLTQPWATLVAIGAKHIETRSWRTDYRGPLAIHAAKGKDKTGVVITTPFWQVLKAVDINPLDLPLGSVVATCQLVGVFSIPAEIAQLPLGLADRTPYEWAWEGPDKRHYSFKANYYEREFGNYACGRFAWLLADVKQLPEPIPARGSLGLWNWDEPK